MRLVFADTGYWIAFINRADQLNSRIAEVGLSLGSFRIITSEMVLIEVLNHFSSRCSRARHAAFESVSELKMNHEVEVIPLSRAQFGFFALPRHSDESRNP